MGVFRRSALHGCQKIGINAQLDDVLGFRISGQFGVHYLVAKIPKSGRLWSFDKEVGISAPLAMLERSLVYGARASVRASMVSRMRSET